MPRSFSSQLPQPFIVTSQGLSATRWLSFVLASHEYVFVTHGHHSLDSVIRGSFRQEKSLNNLDSLTIGTQLEEFYQQKTLHEVFEMYRAMMPDAKAYGSVHSYTVETLVSAAINSDQGLAGINIVNLIRHPVNYIASHCSLVRNARDYQLPIYYNHYEKFMFMQALAKYPELVLLENFGSNSYEFIDFVVSCLSVCNQIKDFAYNQFEHIQMEKLTTDAVALKEFCEFLTGCEYLLPQVEAFIQEGAINRHQSQSPKSPEAIYASWETWKQDIAHMMIPTELIDKFEENGYDVSMLKMKLNAHDEKTKNKVGASQEDRLHSHLQQPQAELWRLQFYLQQSQAELERSQSQLQQTQAQLQQAQAEIESLRYPYPNPTLIADFGLYNVLAWRGNYYGLPKGLGSVDVTSDDLSQQDGILIEQSLENLIAKLKDAVPNLGSPILIEDFGAYNIIAWKGNCYGLPKELGSVEFDEDVSQLKGVLIERSLDKLKRLIVNHLVSDEELERSQSLLQQTHTQLQQTHTQLQQTHAQLQQTHAQLQQTQGELERTQSQLQQTQAAFERSQSQIQAMQSSKFWKLRQIWFRFKRTLGLNHTPDTISL